MTFFQFLTLLATFYGLYLLAQRMGLMKKQTDIKEKEYKQNQAKIYACKTYYEPAGQNTSSVQLKVTNTGKRPMTITHVSVECSNNKHMTASVDGGNYELTDNGKPLRIDIEPGHPCYQWKTNEDLEQCRFAVLGANGKKYPAIYKC